MINAHYARGYMSKMASAGVPARIAKALLVKKAQEATGYDPYANKVRLENGDLVDPASAAGERALGPLTAMSLSQMNEDYTPSEGGDLELGLNLARAYNDMANAGGSEEDVVQALNDYEASVPEKTPSNDEPTAKKLSRLDKILGFAKNNRRALGGAGGALAGGGLGALLGSKLTKNPKNKRRNAILAALALAAAGGAAGQYGASKLRV